jgi:hypothetical protein
LQPYPFPVVQDFIIFPIAAGNHQNGIRYRLTGQTRARRAKGNRNFIAVGRFQDFCNLFFSVGFNDNLGDQTIKAGIGAVGKGAQRVGDQTLLNEVKR